MKKFVLTPLAAAVLSASTFAADEAPKTFTLDKVTVAATLTEQKIVDVASSVSVISTEDMEAHGATNIRDIVRYEPGVAVGTQAGDGARFGFKGFNIRGLDENRVKIMVDGVDQADSFVPAGSPYQRAGRNYIDIDSMKQVEILKGPASTLYGSDALGGAVAFTTKDPSDYLNEKGDDTSASIKLQHNSVDSSFAQTLTLANRTGNLDSLLVYTRRNADEVEKHSDANKDIPGSDRTEADPVNYESDNYLAKLQYQLNDKHRIGLTIEDFKSYTETDVQSKLEGSYSDYYDGEDTVTRKRYGIFHSWEADTALFDKVHWTIDKQYSESDQDTHHVYRGDHRLKAYRQEEENLKVNIQFDKNIGVHQLTYGASYEDTDLTNVTDTFNFDDPSSNTFDRYVPLVEGKNYGAFFQDQITLLDGKLILTPGVRYDKFEAKPQTDDKFTPASAIEEELTDHKSDKVTVRLGSVYKFDDTYSVFAQYSQGFKSPDLIDMYYGSHRNYGPGFNYLTLPNPELDPEESDSYEIGFRANGNLGNFEITAFYNDYKNFIEEDTLGDSYNGSSYDSVSQQVNLEDVTIKGLELRAAIWLDTAINAPAGTSLQLSMAYAKGTNETNNEPIASVTPLNAVIGLSYDSPTNIWGSTLNWTLVEEKNENDIPTLTERGSPVQAASTHGYGTLDLTAYYNVTENFAVKGGFYNLGDKKYSEWENVRGLKATTNLDSKSEPGRNFNISATYTF